MFLPFAFQPGSSPRHRPQSHRGSVLDPAPDRERRRDEGSDDDDERRKRKKEKRDRRRREKEAGEASESG